MVFVRSSYDWSGKFFGRCEDGASEIQIDGPFCRHVADVPAVGLFGFQVLVVYRGGNSILHWCYQRI